MRSPPYRTVYLAELAFLEGATFFAAAFFAAAFFAKGLLLAPVMRRSLIGCFTSGLGFRVFLDMARPIFGVFGVLGVDSVRRGPAAELLVDLEKVQVQGPVYFWLAWSDARIRGRSAPTRSPPYR